MGNLSKSEQIKSVFLWLSKGTLPGYVASFHKTNLWIREPVDNRLAMALTNSSFDAAENLTLKLKTTARSIKVYDMDCKESTIASSAADGAYREFVIPVVQPWQMRLIVAE